MTISETTDRVQAIGREFLKPMPKGWTQTLWENSEGWSCSAFSREKWNESKWPKRSEYEAIGKGATPDEARRLCREEAERKAGL